MKKTILVTFGTRPEAIKMAPLVKALKNEESFKVVVCVTGQHQEMLQQVLDYFEIVPDFNLSIMDKKQTLTDITTRIISLMGGIFDQTNPDLVLVHGDTTTTFATALAAFYAQIPVGHVEAGLRTYDKYSPFPEEFNRQSVGLIAEYHFAPTTAAAKNLIDEGKNPDTIFVTGNTAIDALKITIDPEYEHPILEWVGEDKLILITAHRRENLGEPLRSMFRAIRRVLEENPELKAVYPIHFNPQVRAAADEVFKDESKLKIIKPLNVYDFQNLMSRAHLVLTDSGGIQEEAPSLGIPVLVMRNTTERPEGIVAGTLKLVGTDEQVIYDSFSELINNSDKYNEMSNASNPYGDGFASNKIVGILKGRL